MIRLAGLWRQVNEHTGEVYYEGTLGSGKIYMFEVKNKGNYPNPNSPDMALYITEKGGKNRNEY